MSAQSGVSERTIRNLMNDAVVRNLYKRTFIALMELQPRPGRRLVSGLPTLRKVEALATLGWTRVEIAKRAGISHRTLISANLRGYHCVYTSTHARVDAVYRILRTRPAPRSRQSELTMRQARTRGFAPPWMWEADAIDAVDSIVAGEDLLELADRRWAAAISLRYAVPQPRRQAVST